MVLLGRWALRAALRLAYAVRVTGLEHYVEAGPRVLIVANHTSFLDAALLDARRVHGGRHIIVEDVERAPLTYNQLLVRVLLLGRLIAKGVIVTQGEGRRWQYSPAVPRERCVAQDLGADRGAIGAFDQLSGIEAELAGERERFAGCDPLLVCERVIGGKRTSGRGRGPGGSCLGVATMTPV